MKLLLALVGLMILGVVAANHHGHCPYSKGAGYSQTSQVSYKKSGKCPISGAQLSALRLALKEANKDGSLGAKVGQRYLQAHPEAKAQFPSADSSNKAFLGKSAACFHALTRFFSGDNFDKSRGCPYTARTRGHYTTAQQLDFGKALVETVVAQLGDRVTGEIKSALQATVKAVRAAAGAAQVRCPVSASDRGLIRSTLKAANRDGSLGPKAFAKFFEANPSAQNALGDGDYSAKASTCISALTLYFNPSFFSTSTGCPYVSRVKGRYSPEDLKQFRLAVISTIKENLGDDLSTQAKQAFQNAYALVEARNKH